MESVKRASVDRLGNASLCRPPGFFRCISMWLVALALGEQLVFSRFDSVGAVDCPQLQESVKLLAANKVLESLRREPISLSAFNYTTLEFAQSTTNLILAREMDNALREHSKSFLGSDDQCTAFLRRLLTANCFKTSPDDTYSWQQVVDRVPMLLSYYEREWLFEATAEEIDLEFRRNKIDLKTFESTKTAEEAVQLLFDKLTPVVEELMKKWPEEAIREISLKQCLAGVKPLLVGRMVFQHTGTKTVSEIFGPYLEPNWMDVPLAKPQNTLTSGSGIYGRLYQMQDEITAALSKKKIDFKSFLKYQSPQEAFQRLRGRIRRHVVQLREKWTPYERAAATEDGCVDVILATLDPAKVFTNTSDKTAHEIFGGYGEKKWEEVIPTPSGAVAVYNQVTQVCLSVSGAFCLALLFV
ncbi:hypothetical protein TGRUB_286040 [Toxoplasma gondii RUB]|uniref:Uncharacterized protein n=1 Tax=Toxoplasma gondii RUB TaxID=935652 RepID=A0A086M323_TOXGO|nr:hypothetical protein TGRUB_286040 [Toxoplasma gondii RUB]